MNNIINQMPYLRTSREFPEDSFLLRRELIKSYIDTANVVNARIIGLFSTNVPAITGESYFLLNNQRQQTLRQVYTFTSTASINHNIVGIKPGDFVTCWGSYTDATNTYALVWGTSVAVAGLITFYLTATQIVFVVGAGAPALTSGRIILTWLSAV